MSDLQARARAIRAAFQCGLFTGGVLGWIVGLALGIIVTVHFVG